MTFKPGQSGNAKGRPKGIVDRRLRFKHLLEENGEKIISKAIELANQGDIEAIRLCMERLVAKPKDNPIFLNLPDEATIAETLDKLMQNVRRGRITPGEAKSIADIIAIRNDAARTEALTEKLSQFEVFMKTIGGQTGQQSSETDNDT